MRRYLVVANQTLGGTELITEIRKRITQDADAEFRVVVPLTRPEDFDASWAPIDPQFGVTPVAGDATEQLERARKNADQRLRVLLNRIEEAGGRARGDLGDADPMTAIETALNQTTFDEVILSTLPAGVSRWLGMDLPSRVRRSFDGPVTTVIAEPR